MSLTAYVQRLDTQQSAPEVLNGTPAQCLHLLIDTDNEVRCRNKD